MEHLPLIQLGHVACYSRNISIQVTVIDIGPEFNALTFWFFLFSLNFAISRLPEIDLYSLLLIEVKMQSATPFPPPFPFKIQFLLLNFLLESFLWVGKGPTNHPDSYYSKGQNVVQMKRPRSRNRMVQRDLICGLRRYASKTVKNKGF